MVTKPKENEVPEEKKETLEDLKNVVEKEKESRIEVIRKEIIEFAKSRGEEAREITVGSHSVTAKFFDSDGREVRSYSRKLV